MKLTSVVYSIATLKVVLATTYSVELYVDSTDSSIAGKALSSIHEGAGINYFLLGTSPEVLTFDDSTLYLGGEVGYVSTYDNYLLEGVLGAGNITFDGEHLVVNDVKDFYAAMNVNDPYQYSTQLYIVLTSNLDAPDSIKFNIKVSGLPSSLASSSSAVAESGSDTASSSASSFSTSSTFGTTELLAASASSAVVSSTQSESSTTSSIKSSESEISKTATTSTSKLATSSSIANSTLTTTELTLSAKSKLITSITTDSATSTLSSSATKTESSSSKGAANRLHSAGAEFIDGTSTISIEDKAKAYEVVIECLDLFHDIFGDAEFPYELPVFVQGDYLNKLRTLEPQVKEMCKKIDKNKFKELKSRGEETWGNINRFI